MSYETIAEEQRNVFQPIVALQEQFPQMMPDKTTAEQCVHMPQSTIALQDATSLSDYENGMNILHQCDCV